MNHELTPELSELLGTISCLLPSHPIFQCTLYPLFPRQNVLSLLWQKRYDIASPVILGVSSPRPNL